MAHRRVSDGAIRLDDEGFDILVKDAVGSRVNWCDVRGIAAYKSDVFTVDRIEVAFNIGDLWNSPAATEEMTGYDELVKEIERRYPNYDQYWWRKVAFPPFAFCWTVIWGNYPEPAECPQCKGDISDVTTDICPLCRAPLETMLCSACRGRAGLFPQPLNGWVWALTVGILVALLGPLTSHGKMALLSLENSVFSLVAAIIVMLVFFGESRRRISCPICENTGWIDPRGRAVRAALGYRARCDRCGYSMNGLTTSRCPECGHENPV